MKGIYLSLGTNLGNKHENLHRALTLINEQIGLVVQKSSIHETKAWGNTNQPDFLNMVIKIETKFEPVDLLKKCLSIENEMGRERVEKWGARIIDIDILYYNDVVINNDELTLPHPFINQRDFVLLPLKEIIS